MDVFHNSKKKVRSKFENCSNSTTFLNPSVNSNVLLEEVEINTPMPTFPTFSPDDLVCGTCKEELVGQTHRIYNFQGGIALVVAFLELIPIFLAYKQWKHHSKTEEDTALNSF